MDDSNYLIRSVGKIKLARAVDYQKKIENYNQVKPILESYCKKFPTKFFFYDSGKKGTKENEILINFIPCKVASYFAVIRDQALRHWNVWNLGLDYIGSENNPFDIAPLKINVKSLLDVSKLLTTDHILISTLKPEEVSKCDNLIKILALDKHRATYFFRSRENDQT